MINAMGWAGSICLAICGFPQALQCYRQGHADGIAPMFLWLWVCGELLTASYIIQNANWPLLINYGINSFVVALVLRYKYFPRKSLQ